MTTTWVSITGAAVVAAMPTDLAPLYSSWISANPDKATSLARIIEDTVLQVRNAIRTNKANTLDDDATAVPQDVRPQVYDLIHHRLSMEMGVDLETAANQVRQDADQLLRQIAYGRWTVDTAAGQASPRYTPPTAPRSALPAIFALILAVLPADGAWVSQNQVTDPNVLMTYIPTNYTPIASTLFAHMGALDAKIKTLATTGTAAAAYTVATNAQADALASYALASQAVSGVSGVYTNTRFFGSIIVTNSKDAYATVLVKAWEANAGAALYADDAEGWLGAWRGTNGAYLAASTNDAGYSTKLARRALVGGTATYYELVDSETFTPAQYFSTASYQTAVTNWLRFMTTATAPTGATASGSRGEVRTDTTNLYIYTASNLWLRVPGSYAWP